MLVEKQFVTGDIGTIILQNGQEIIGEVAYQDSLATSLVNPMIAYFDTATSETKMRPFAYTGITDLGLDKRGNKIGVLFSHDMVVTHMKSTPAGIEMYTAAIGA